MNFKKRIPGLVAAAVLALSIAQPAFAQSSPQLSGYNKQAGQVQDGVSGSEAPSNASGGVGGAGSGPAGADTGAATGDTQQAAGSGLPFTGLDVGMLLAAATVLLGLGLGLRRLAGAPQAL